MKNCVIIIVCVDEEVDESVLTEGIMCMCDSVCLLAWNVVCTEMCVRQPCNQTTLLFTYSLLPLF